MGNLDFVYEMAVDGGMHWFDNRIYIKVDRWSEDAGLKKVRCSVVI